MAATGTATDRALIAKEYKTSHTFWIAIAHPAEWPGGDVPPPTDDETTELENPILYQKPDLISLLSIVPPEDPDPEVYDVLWNGLKFRYVADEDAVAEAAYYVYFELDLNGDGGKPTDNFRQYGLFTDLVPQAGYESHTWLAPANVSDPGYLRYYDNIEKITFGPTHSQLIKIVRTVRG